MTPTATRYWLAANAGIFSTQHQTLTWNHLFPTLLCGGICLLMAVFGVVSLNTSGGAAGCGTLIIGIIGTIVFAYVGIRVFA